MTAPDRRDETSVLVFPDTDNIFFQGSSWSDFSSNTKDSTPQPPKRGMRRRKSMTETYRTDVFGSDILNTDPWVDFSNNSSSSFTKGNKNNVKGRDSSINTTRTCSDSEEEELFSPAFPTDEGTMPLKGNGMIESNRARVHPRERQGRSPGRTAALSASRV